VPNTLTYQPVFDDYEGLVIQPLIDGQPLQDFFPKSSVQNHPISAFNIHFNHATTAFDIPIRPYTEEAIILACGCGEWGCSNNSVMMQADDAIVTWSNPKTHPNNPDVKDATFDTLTFDRAQYEAVLNDIHRAYREHTIQQLTAKLLPLEQSHLDPATRNDPDAMAALLHPKFTEIGASGRTYTREETLKLLQSETETPMYSIVDFTAHLVPPHDPLTNTIRTQYILTATFADGTQRESCRTTIWQNDWFKSRWQMLFHQGTPIP